MPAHLCSLSQAFSNAADSLRSVGTRKASHIRPLRRGSRHAQPGEHRPLYSQAGASLSEVHAQCRPILILIALICVMVSSMTLERQGFSAWALLAFWAR